MGILDPVSVQIEEQGRDAGGAVRIRFERSTVALEQLDLVLDTGEFLMHAQVGSLPSSLSIGDRTRSTTDLEHMLDVLHQEPTQAEEEHFTLWRALVRTQLVDGARSDKSIQQLGTITLRQDEM